VIRLDELLRRYGPEADGARASLRIYTAAKREDLFPRNPGDRPNPRNPATEILLQKVQDAVLALQPVGEAQHWRKSQALIRVSQIADARWSIAEGDQEFRHSPLIIIVTMWLSVLFVTYGLFMPRHLTALVAVVLAAVVVAS